MKQKDILVIVVVAIFAGVVSLVVSKIFFTSSGNKSLQAEVVKPITTDFQKPSSENGLTRVYNRKAINPTKLIQIGDNHNKQPF